MSGDDHASVALSYAILPQDSGRGETVMQTSNQRLQELLDKQEIIEQIYNYGRSMDRLDLPLGKGVFHPEARADYDRQMYQGDGWGFVEMALKAHPSYLVHSHQFSNILIQV